MLVASLWLLVAISTRLVVANLTAITGMLLNVGLMIVNDGLLWFGLFLRTGSEADGAASDTSVARGKDHGAANSGLRA